MSGWDAYVSSLLDNTDGIKRAAIVGLDGSTWARSTDFKVSVYSVFVFRWFLTL